jgi:hypothetical protein
MKYLGLTPLLYFLLISKSLLLKQFRLGGGGRNRTRSSPTTSLNILIYKEILTLILKGFKRFLALHATYRT